MLDRIPEEQLDLQTQEADREEIDRQAKLAQTPSSWKERLSSNTLDDQTADRDNVRADQRSRSQGGDDVEGDGTSQVDQGDEHRKDIGEYDCVEGDVPARTNLREPSRARRPLVPGLAVVNNAASLACEWNTYERP